MAKKQPKYEEQPQSLEPEPETWTETVDPSQIMVADMSQIVTDDEMPPPEETFQIEETPKAAVPARAKANKAVTWEQAVMTAIEKLLADDVQGAAVQVTAALDAGGRDNITVQVINSPDSATANNENLNSRTLPQPLASRQLFSSPGTLVAKIATLAIIFSLGIYAAWQLLNG